MAIRGFVPAVVASIAMGLWVAAVMAEEPAPPQEAPAQAAPAQAAPTSADDAREQLGDPSPTTQPATGGSARTRYHRFNGRWWYWLPSGQWALWDGKQWTIPSPKANDYQDWRSQQFAGRYSNSAAQDEAFRRREFDRWRSQATGRPLANVAQADANYRGQIDRLHDNLMITPYDYRIGTAGHGLFDANPDRVIGSSGKLNYANSVGGYMGGALRSPYGY